jgi:succinate dehydrogenase / fumarate reductase cytochrome b subunit
MSSADMKANRPLSPHLQIYRWKMTMAMSIAHRVTGIGLYFGMALLAWWLMAAASSERAFAIANAVLGSWLGMLVMFLASFALIHHLLGGLRHFIWDFGAGFGKPARDQLAVANLVGSVVLTLLLWAVGLMLR